MAPDVTKPIISLCPFQTQLIVQIPLTKGQIVTGPVPSPQILKVQCDRDKCQLWDSNESVCAVSAIPDIWAELAKLTDVLHSRFGDMVEEMKSIRSAIAPPLQT